MRNVTLFLHLAAAIFWMGGMSFMVPAVRPSIAAQVAPPQRLPLMTTVLRRFFRVVAASIVVLLATGAMMLQTEDQPGLGWIAIAAVMLWR